MAGLENFRAAIEHIHAKVTYKGEGDSDIWLSWKDLQKAMKEGTPKDCEDCALNMAFFVRRLAGEDLDGELHFVIGDVPQGRHAWVEYTSPSGEVYVGDWTSGRVFNKRLNMRSYTPAHSYKWGGLEKLWQREA